jgi:hypothetical protein
MMKFGAALASLFLLAGAGLAQVTAIRYPPFAAAARVQGDVRLRSGPDGVVPISGPPLLVQAAIVGIKALGQLPERSAVDVVFHFSLIEPSVREVAVGVKKGNAFDRLILRALGFKTEKTMIEKECVIDPGPLPGNRIDSTKAPIEVWIYGRRLCPTING